MPQFSFIATLDPYIYQFETKLMLHAPGPAAQVLMLELSPPATRSKVVKLIKS